MEGLIHGRAYFRNLTVLWTRAVSQSVTSVFDYLETVPKGNLLLKVFFLYNTVVTRFPVQLSLGTYDMDYELKLKAVLVQSIFLGAYEKAGTNTRFFDQRSIKITLAPQFPAKFTSP